MLRAESRLKAISASRARAHPRVSDFQHCVAHFEALPELAHALEHVAGKPIHILGEMKGGAERGRRSGTCSGQRHDAGSEV